jgi:hypothetical protein
MTAAAAAAAAAAQVGSTCWSQNRLYTAEASKAHPHSAQLCLNPDVESSCSISCATTTRCPHHTYQPTLAPRLQTGCSPAHSSRRVMNPSLAATWRLRASSRSALRRACQHTQHTSAHISSHPTHHSHLTCTALLSQQCHHSVWFAEQFKLVERCPQQASGHTGLSHLRPVCTQQAPLP